MMNKQTDEVEPNQTSRFVVEQIGNRKIWGVWDTALKEWAYDQAGKRLRLRSPRQANAIAKNLNEAYATPKLGQSRSNRAEVRNPILALPAARQLDDLPTPARDALIAVLLGIKADAAERANECWRKHKAPMAAYWKAVSVYSGHIARALKRQAN